jgi:hypothetical protein
VYIEDIRNSYRIIYNCEVREKDLKDDAALRARKLAALQRLYCMDYDTWV